MSYFINSIEKKFDYIMEILKEVDAFICKNPGKQFCLHNGFAGFSYGSPSNPVFIKKEEALKYLLKYYEITGINPLEVMETKLNTLLFDDNVPELYQETGYRMLGYNTPEECLYGNNGLG
jgi:hypothetical protein